MFSIVDIQTAEESQFEDEDGNDAEEEEGEAPRSYPIRCSFTITKVRARGPSSSSSSVINEHERVLILNLRRAEHGPGCAGDRHDVPGRDVHHGQHLVLPGREGRDGTDGGGGLEAAWAVYWSAGASPSGCIPL